MVRCGGGGGGSDATIKKEDKKFIHDRLDSPIMQNRSRFFIPVMHSDRLTALRGKRTPG